MIKKFKCIRDFKVDKYDDNGFYTEEKEAIKEGEIFEHDTDNRRRMLGGSDMIRLMNDKHWLEMLEETFNHYFVEVM